MSYSDDTIAFAKEKEDILSEMLKSDREHSAKNVSDKRERNSFERDYARVLYSSSFRRLQGKMQLFEVDPEKFNRNRLTHSLEVAQIARSIASELDLKYPVVAELASLAHDIGNPPFGHSGENKLHNLSANFGGYEGNAQALRILRTLETKYHYCNGLDLTYRSLLSVVKYPYENNSKNKKFLYNEDYQFYIELMEKTGLALKDGEKTIDAQIMDLSDEIAYAAHDLEDALSRSMVNIEDIEYEFQISKYNSALADFRDIVKQSKETASQAKRLNSSEEFAIIFRKELTANIVNCLINDIAVVKKDNDYKQLGFGTKEYLSLGLKKLLFKVIMRKRNIKTYEHRGDKIIEDLYNFYTKGRNIDFISPQLYRTLPAVGTSCYEHLRNRAVIDYISGMMDTFAIREWETHCGKFL
ncbi:dNTP triphosphohydrolase [Cronobacter dublinensis]|uniref:deoxyguanosinetriphosphate triphosphohydrolase family protein n=1 Tax=Cronobacter dublinensis TaxID=413497 RepID=UPI0027393E5B|nr:dNTP triphosphohydrolase [Cronobacter dublinensis]ELQ6123085.1 dNTP triphosphohydrolase [Cronobacter dublinensis]